MKEGGRGRDRPPDPSGERLTRDAQHRWLRDWFNPRAQPLVAGPFVPRELAWQVLQQRVQDLGGPQVLLSLRDRPVLKVGGGLSLRFTQEFKGLPVWASEVLVNMHADGRVHSLYNQYHYDIPQALDPARARVTPVAARTQVARLARAYDQREIGRPALGVYRYAPFERPLPGRPRRKNRARARFLAAVAAQFRRGRAAGYVPVEGQHYLVWGITLTTHRPLNRWWLLVDAVAGHLLEVRDLLSYARGRGKVFDPNPVVTSGDPNLSSNTPISTLNAERVSVALDRLDPADSDGFLRLDGAWVRMEDTDLPSQGEPQSATGRFVFSSKNWKFQDVMAYYHVDRFQQYIQDALELTGVADFSIAVDPQAGTADGSSGSQDELLFGVGGVPGASDAMVILHEYGHALQDAVSPGSNVNNFPSGVAEGFCDFIAAVHYDDKHASQATRGIMFSWDFNPTDAPNAARRYDLPAPASAAGWQQGGGYDKGALWASTMFELFRKLGGDAADLGTKARAQDLVIRLHLIANANIPASDATIAQTAQQIEAADTNLAGWRYPNGLHLKVIYDTFSRRKVPGYDPRPVDVYVDDGRGGGYGAADGNDDNFANMLWLDDHTDTQDMWVRLAVYGPGAAPSPADHEAPVVNQPAHLYVRVKNRGAQPSGPVTARAFRAAAAGPRAWPVDRTEIPPPAQQPADVPAGGAVTAGPFTWTPARAAKTSVLVIIECAQDRAVTQDVGPNDHVPFADLVPFDNNIAMRDLTVI